MTGADGSVPGTGKGGRWFSQGGEQGDRTLPRADRTIRSSSSEREKKTGEKEDEDALKTELAE